MTPLELAIVLAVAVVWAIALGAIHYHVGPDKPFSLADALAKADRARANALAKERRRSRSRWGSR